MAGTFWGVAAVRPTLARMFPDARFVHIFRDGRDTALSMQRHHFFRLRVQGAKLLRLFGLDPLDPFNLPGTSPWMPYFERARFRFFNAERFRQTEIPLPDFGQYWSEMIGKGVGYLNELPQDRVLSLRFESILDNPHEEMTRFIRFVGPEFENQEWLNAVAAIPSAKTPAWQRLDAAEQTQLTAACAPGLKILGYAI